MPNVPVGSELGGGRVKRTLAAFAVALGWASIAAAEAPPPLEAYGKLPGIEAIQISPDGKRLAFIATDGEARTLVVSDIDTNKPIVRLPTGPTKVIAVQWAGPDHVIASAERDTDVSGLSGGTRAWVVAADIDLVRLRSHPLIDVHNKTRNGENMSVVYGAPQLRTVNGKTQVYVQGIHFVDRKGMLSLFRYDPSADGSWLTHPGDAHTQGWLVGQDGEPLAQQIYDTGAKRWSLRTRMGGNFATAIALTANIEQPSIEGLGRDGQSTVLSVPVDDPTEGVRTEVVEFKPGDTKFGAPLMDHAPDALLFDPATERLMGTADLKDDAWTYTFFDLKDQQRWKALIKIYAGSDVHLRSMSADHQRWIVSVDSPAEGQAYALVDFASGKAQWLGNNFDAPNRFLSEKKPIAFEAGDGLNLTGYLTLPKGREPTNLPLVVFPHGGPAARDAPGFDWWAQAMASRGYAVLQVNFRGSDGFGWRHLSAGFGQWGRRMQTDLSDGVRDLAKKGVIDPKRVCIVGGSYGGYAALAGATLDPGVYRCAVSVAGISDLRRLVKWSDENSGHTSKRYWLRFLGVTNAGDSKLDEISPLRHVDKVNIPILLIHGKDDTVVDYSQSELMFEALKSAGKDVELVPLPHEDHWLLSGATRLKMLQATMDFLAKTNPPG